MSLSSLDSENSVLSLELRKLAFGYLTIYRWQWARNNHRMWTRSNRIPHLPSSSSVTTFRLRRDAAAYGHCVAQPRSYSYLCCALFLHSASHLTMREVHDPGTSASTERDPGCFPVKNSTTPYWRCQPHSIDQHRSTEELPRECDVAIIGSGMAGVSIAYHLMKDLKEGELAPSIVLLEARQVCSGATGRNGVSRLAALLQSVRV